MALSTKLAAEELPLPVVLSVRRVGISASVRVKSEFFVLPLAGVNLGLGSNVDGSEENAFLLTTTLQAFWRCQSCHAYHHDPLFEVAGWRPAAPSLGHKCG